MLNLLLMATSMTTVYFALMDFKIPFYVSLAIFLLVSLKNVWNDTKDFNGLLIWNCKKQKGKKPIQLSHFVKVPSEDAKLEESKTDTKTEESKLEGTTPYAEKVVPIAKLPPIHTKTV